VSTVKDTVIIEEIPGQADVLLFGPASQDDCELVMADYLNAGHDAWMQNAEDFNGK
tara:strand:- start:143 stop:310 length:168 start_codon:yes stop_codon:yes gene_type:complete